MLTMPNKPRLVVFSSELSFSSISEPCALASDQGMPLAQYELSKIYYHGESGEIAPDYNKAKDLCRKAAEQGLPEAKWALENKFNSKNN